MRALYILAALSLTACRATKVTTETDYTSTLTYVDTTKTEITAQQTTTLEIAICDSSASAESVSIVEFVETGGRIDIDSAGNISLSGVRHIAGRKTATAEVIEKDSRLTADTDETLIEQAAVDLREDTRATISESKTPGRQWYESLFFRIGQGVCIAALMWLLFLYLRRRL